MKWNESTIGDNIITKKGFAFKSAKYVSNGVPVVRVSDYTLDSISDADLKYYPVEEKTNYLDYQLHEKDVIVQTVGSWQNNPDSVVGKVVRVPYFLDGALLNQNAVILIPKKSINREFLFYRLKTDEFKGHVIGEARGAANQASITLETIKSFKFLLPDYDEQFRIASILSAYDDLIENNQKQIKLLEEAAQRLYKEWFVDLHFPGYEDTEIIDGVPKGWKNVPLNTVTDLKAGGDKPKAYSEFKTADYEVPIFSNGITDKGIYGYTNKAVIEKESVTISARGTVGFVFLRRTPFVPIVRLISVTPKDGMMDVLYLYLNLSNQNYRSTGAAQQQITVPLLKDKSIICPKTDVRESFNNAVLPVFNMIDILEKQITICQQARDRLLPKLMSGELEV